MINLNDINFRQKLNYFRYRVRTIYNRVKQRTPHVLDSLTVIAALWSILNIIFQVGFSASQELQSTLYAINRCCIIYFGIAMVIKLIDSLSPTSNSRFSYYLLIYPIVTWAYIYGMTASGMGEMLHAFLNHKYVVSAALIFLSINEMSRLGLSLLGRRTNPTILFVCSFLVFIIIGTALLLLPRSHYGNLSFFNALFTATSSV